MEYILLGIAIAVLYIWFKSKTGKASQTSTGSGRQTKSSAKSAPSGKFAFQESGSEPKRDAEGRVIVKLKGGTTGVSFVVNRSRLDTELANKLAGKVNEDEEFNKSVKVRIRPDLKSQYANSVLVETTGSKFLGWIWKDDSDSASSVLREIREAVIKSAPELESSEFTFEVSARIEGYWNEVSEEGPKEWEADFDLFEIRIKAPVEVEVE